MPTGWTLSAIDFLNTGNPAVDATWLCSPSSGDAPSTTGRCNTAEAVADTAYDYELTMTGPSDDHTSALTLSYTDDQGTHSVAPSPAVINP